MRDSEGPASLGELMGEGADKNKTLTLEDLPGLLGDKMPHITYDRVGKLRLVNALHQRFGAGYGNVPGVRSIMDHFEKEFQAESIVRMNMRRHK